MMAIHDLVSAMNSKKQVDTLTLDFSRAFDRAPHQRLLYKLSHYGIQRSMLSWIQVFLTKRTQRVSLGGCFIKSVFCEIRSPSRHGFRAITVPDLHISYITSASPLKNLI